MCRNGSLPLWNLSSGSSTVSECVNMLSCLVLVPIHGEAGVDEPAGLTGLRDRAISQVSQGPTAQPGPQSHLRSTGPPFMTLALTPHPGWRELILGLLSPTTEQGASHKHLRAVLLIHAQHLHCSPLSATLLPLIRAGKGDWFGLCSPWSYGGRKPVFF